MQTKCAKKHKHLCNILNLLLHKQAIYFQQWYSMQASKIYYQQRYSMQASKIDFQQRYSKQVSKIYFYIETVTNYEIYYYIDSHQLEFWCTCTHAPVIFIRKANLQRWCSPLTFLHQEMSFCTKLCLTNKLWTEACWHKPIAALNHGEKVSPTNCCTETRDRLGLSRMRTNEFSVDFCTYWSVLQPVHVLPRVLPGVIDCSVVSCRCTFPWLMGLSFWAY